ncbi:iron-sulfur cluster co-chaperone protein HscB homolog isoform X1 [Nicotiana tabacum]|uniref:Iron-sulfur cluster co-chaperone protein HscB homolog isoform X1 n=1 Tax=Nicotiana tabacum TaxID=4097 RepID=A0A1S3Y3S0_TOBAC|nr:iron-sulfur cluster co-chaperone protein HscB homolog isoform X1 [Nicotiana tomentosiformis]XP_016446791.1 PREDICTED: iron-sulfur cluster co-chaperone protein HscB, mitochondrial-like isoform X1 [Nicotiana tabacum]
MWTKKLRTLTSFPVALLRREITTFSVSPSQLHFPVSSSISPQVDQFPQRYDFSGRFHFCSEAAQKLICWNCNAVSSTTTPFLVCNACGCVQPVDQSVDYFHIFGLEKKYGIEGENLERKYKDWQRKLHPDLVHTKSEKEKEYAAEQSARVINAYRTLTDPLSRAIYILKLEGVHVDEEERIDDLELLAEIMELRETVEEAANSQALKQIQGEIQGKFEQSSISFANALQHRKYEEAVAATQRMTYYKRANEEIVKKL